MRPMRACQDASAVQLGASAPGGSRLVPAGAPVEPAPVNVSTNSAVSAMAAHRAARAPGNFSYSHDVRLDGMELGSKCSADRF